DGCLAKHNYLVNDRLSVADFAVAAPLFHAQGAALPIAPYANGRAWFERVSSLPCWSETAPQMRAAA
ncbi:MAG: glutathione binding-like protein, partial [Xanthobacteraceae bacterium]